MILFLVESPTDSSFHFLSWSSDANRQQGLSMTENRKLGAGRFRRADARDLSKTQYLDTSPT